MLEFAVISTNDPSPAIPAAWLYNTGSSDAQPVNATKATTATAALTVAADRPAMIRFTVIFQPFAVSVSSSPSYGSPSGSITGQQSVRPEMNPRTTQI
jgi:hypothetical protein